jgi:hypothetical protein
LPLRLSFLPFSFFYIVSSFVTALRMSHPGPKFTACDTCYRRKVPLCLPTINDLKSNSLQIKCDSERPCNECLHQQSECTYTRTSPRRRRKNTVKRVGLVERIRRLDERRANTVHHGRCCPMFVLLLSAHLPTLKLEMPLSALSPLRLLRHKSPSILQAGNLEIFSLECRICYPRIFNGSGLEPGFLFLSQPRSMDPVKSQRPRYYQTSTKRHWTYQKNRC